MGPTSSSGKTLTAKRLGFLLADSYKIHSDQPVRGGPRGYHLAHFVKPWTAMGIPLSLNPTQAMQVVQTMQVTHRIPRVHRIRGEGMRPEISVTR